MRTSCSALRGRAPPSSDPNPKRPRPFLSRQRAHPRSRRRLSIGRLARSRGSRRPIRFSSRRAPPFRYLAAPRNGGVRGAAGAVARPALVLPDGVRCPHAAPRPALPAHSGLRHALCSVSDLKPEVNYYWHHGEEVVVHGHRKGRVDPVRFQIDDHPHLQIRVPKQLPEIVPLESDLGDVPVIDHKPSKLPLFKKQYENKVFIGSKVADPCCYGHTQFHLIPDKLKRERFVRAHLEDQIEVLYRANGIASLFAWTAAQAMYQGFWSEADVTRPFVSQAVVTDGKYFAFFCYQLNTLALTVETIRNNPRKNICWGTDSKPLYDVVEDGSVKGFNDEVMRQLVRFLLNRPKEL
nr:PREDICTED: 28S ribosomal protein S30, mitochondrial [Opisthocomus hoazin]